MIILFIIHTNKWEDIELCFFFMLISFFTFPLVHLTPSLLNCRYWVFILERKSTSLFVLLWYLLELIEESRGRGRENEIQGFLDSRRLSTLSFRPMNLKTWQNIISNKCMSFFFKNSLVLVENWSIFFRMRIFGNSSFRSCDDKNSNVPAFFSTKILSLVQSLLDVGLRRTLLHLSLSICAFTYLWLVRNVPQFWRRVNSREIKC